MNPPRNLKSEQGMHISGFKPKATYLEDMLSSLLALLSRTIWSVMASTESSAAVNRSAYRDTERENESAEPPPDAGPPHPGS